MIVRLSEALEQNRRFLADASHELRTPLAALRGEMESVVEQTRPLAELSDRAGQRVGGGGSPGKNCRCAFCAFPGWMPARRSKQWERFDLAPLAASTTEQMSFAGGGQGCFASPAMRRGASAWKATAPASSRWWSICLDNAIKYTPAGGAIHLHVPRARRQGGDRSGGYGHRHSRPGALPHIFERFFRVDKARSRERAGRAWDWPLSSRFARRTAAGCDVESAEGRGSRFIVELPLAQKPRGKINI